MAQEPTKNEQAELAVKENYHAAGSDPVKDPVQELQTRTAEENAEWRERLMRDVAVEFAAWCRENKQLALSRSYDAWKKTPQGAALVLSATKA